MHNSISKLMLCLLAFASSFSVFAQEQTITGKVTDGETKEILPGVNVLIKGTSQGTTTDANGEFKMSVQSGAVLICSFIGYETLEVPVGNQTALSIALTIDTRSLEEVVVV